MNKLILFYLGSHPDHQGRYLAEILEQNDHWLEASHDYIQWIFPTTEKSRVKPGAPTITKEIQSEFHKDELLRNHLKASYFRMLEFYGLESMNNSIRKSDNWEKRKSNWFVQDTHNNLRITRILKCLKALGLEMEAIEFYNRERLHSSLDYQSPENYEKLCA